MAAFALRGCSSGPVSVYLSISKQSWHVVSLLICLVMCLCTLATCWCAHSRPAPHKSVELPLYQKLAPPPPQSRQRWRCRIWGQISEPPQSLHLAARFPSVVRADLRAAAVSAARLATIVLAISIRLLPQETHVLKLPRLCFEHIGLFDMLVHRHAFGASRDDGKRRGRA
jgi:hypothetical protein